MSVNSAVCSSRCNCVNLEFVSCMRKFFFWISTMYTNEIKKTQQTPKITWKVPCGFSMHIWTKLWFIFVVVDFRVVKVGLAAHSLAVFRVSGRDEQRQRQRWTTQFHYQTRQIKMHCNSFAITCRSRCQ